MGFKSYIKKLDEEKSIVFSFGRYNPMTESDAELWEFVTTTAKKLRADSHVYTTTVQNHRKNPLNIEDKMIYLKEAIDKFTKVIAEDELKNVYQIANKLVEDGYSKIIFVVHESQKNDFDALKKNIKEASNGMSHLEIKPFKDKKTHQSQLRELVKENDFQSFSKLLPKKLRNEAHELFEKTREGLGI
jgi:GTPase Era involved in 16S rRNA processing